MECHGHSVKTYRKHNKFMNLLKSARKKMTKGSELEDIITVKKKVFYHSDVQDEIPNHHSSHL
jgi:hypothetical protein